MKVKIEEELCGGQEEKERQEGPLLDNICKQPPVEFDTLDMSEEYLGPEWQEPKLPGVKEEELEPPGGKDEDHLQNLNVNKEEQLPPCIKEEEDFTELPVTGVHVKAEDEEKKWVLPLTSDSSQHVTTEIDGEHGEGSQADGWLAPMSDGDDTTSHSSHTEDDHDEAWEGEMPRHTDSKRGNISECGKRFGYKSSLKRHTTCPTGEKPFACSVCSQRFSRQGSLRRHAQTHTGEKPFACSVCGQTFFRKYDLQAHTRTHTGEKPFACLVCGKRFTDNGNLRRHTRIHTGQKPFACLMCGKKFSESTTLRRHTRIHTGEKPFECLVCGQRFSRQESLRIHTQNHTREKPFACSFCGQRFPSKNLAKMHKCAGEKSGDQ